MELAEAFAVMGLTPEASLEEAESRRIELARAKHPDRGGSHEAMTQLWDAWELVRPACARRTSSRALVRRSNGALQMASGVEAALTHVEREKRSARALREVVRHQTSALRRAKRQRGWAALLAAGICVFVSLIETLGLDQWQFTAFGDTVTQRWISPQARFSLIAAFTVLSLVLVLGAWRASMRATWIEEALEDAADTMDDKNDYVSLVREIATVGAIAEEWTQADLRRAIAAWSAVPVTRGRRPSVARSLIALFLLRQSSLGMPMQALAFQVGDNDFAKLVISKGLEGALLSEQHIVCEGLPEFRYAMCI